jgi:hypothetical protein
VLALRRFPGAQDRHAGAINLPDEAMQAQRLLDDSFYVEEDTPYLYTSVWSASVKFGRTTLCI